jgi:hypothetical protein
MNIYETTVVFNTNSSENSPKMLYSKNVHFSYMSINVLLFVINAYLVIDCFKY